MMLLTIGILPIVSGLTEHNQYNLKQLNNSQGNDWWNTFRHDSLNIGLSSSNAPENDDLLWSYQTDYLISSSPAVSHGKVYIGSWDKNIYCLDMTDGEVLWKYTTNGMITSSPTVDNDKVFVGSQDSTFYCLDADDGSIIWTYESEFMIESSPTVIDNRVYFGSSDGSLYCLDAEYGTLIWDYPTGNVIWSSPAVTEDRVYFGSLNGDFFCLDSADGSLEWSFSTNDGIWSSPSFYDGKIYFGSNDDYVYCLDADDGDLIWNYNTGGEVHSSPAIAYGNVYIGAINRGLFCLDAETGDLVWNKLINGGIWSPPSVADGKVYYGTYPCCGAPTYLHCDNASDGEMIWDYNIGGLMGMKSSPAIAAGKLFIGVGDGRIFVFGGNELIADANGPYRGYTNNPIQFTASAYGGAPEYSWYWEFGDGDTSTEKNPSHLYETPGEYDVTLTVTDSKESVSKDYTNTFVILSNNPPDTPSINGYIEGKTGKEYEFEFNTNDPNGDDVKYYIDWGDNKTELTDFYTSGEKVVIKHIWFEKGTFEIKAKAIDVYGDESDWGTLDVTMPKYNPFKFNFIILNWLVNRLPDIFPILRFRIEL